MLRVTRFKYHIAYSLEESLVRDMVLKTREFPRTEQLEWDIFEIKISCEAHHLDHPQLSALLRPESAPIKAPI